MNLPAIGGPAAVPPAATPAAPGAGGAPQAPPFVLSADTSPALAPTLVPSDAPAAQAPPADDAAPLIGWLFASFALAPACAAAAPSPATAAAAPAVTRRTSEPHASPMPTPDWSADTERAFVASVVSDTRDAAGVPAIAASPAATGEDGADPAPPLAAASSPPLPAPASPVCAPTVANAAPQAAAVNPYGALPLVVDVPDVALDLGERIAWLLDQGLSEAILELHPAELGALTIRIETQAQQAQVHIIAAEPAARALLSQHLPQLRELLGASGLTLTRGQVECAERRAPPASGAGEPSVRIARRRITAVTLVDTYV
ncbi:flagellar hook-length control protein FliK [Sinimarinibacterium thermocellulolyticum]|uniref:Flagellar hook-length control protein FliK n=1 Tax=Sinimarinibacterium thermocellulolyticum TaxID=3170016 RepID=A0ABV2AAC7_9GAMM